MEFKARVEYKTHWVLVNYEALERTEGVTGCQELMLRSNDDLDDDTALFSMTRSFQAVPLQSSKFTCSLLAARNLWPAHA